MDTTQTLQQAYTLLPPPLSALPAKYWTSISLWLHSYTVARTFQELLKLANINENPDQDEAFIIGFLHDLVQKLGKSPNSLRQTYTWVLEKLVNNLNWSPYEARKIAKTLETNPAENIRKTGSPDPILPPRIWKLLMVADELQGSMDAISWASKVKALLSREFGKEISIQVYSVNLPQPFVRTQIWKVLEQRLREKLECRVDMPLSECGLLAIASIQGLIVLSNKHMDKIEISWNDIIGRNPYEDATYVLSNSDIYALRKHINEGCKNKSITKTKEYKKAIEDSRFKSFAEKYCDHKRVKNERAGTYTLLLHYYGTDSENELKDIFLPNYTKSLTKNVKISRVVYSDGEYLCPVCGTKHREGFVTGIIGSITNVKSEKWNRFLNINLGKNLNQMLREDKNIRVCPLCTLDMLLESRDIGKGFTVYYTLSLRTPLPVEVLREIFEIIDKIIKNVYTSNKITSPNLKELKRLLLHPETLTRSLGRPPVDVLLDYSGISVSTNGKRWFSGKLENLKLQEKLMPLAIAGLLAYYGLYPITISINRPPALAIPSDILISYDVIYPLYNYTPKTEGKNNSIPVTPFVSATLASMPRLYKDRESDELRRYARHIEEILGFSPQHAPLLLLYSNPEVYFHISGLFSRFMEVNSNE